MSIYFISPPYEVRKVPVGPVYAIIQPLTRDFSNLLCTYEEPQAAFLNSHLFWYSI